MMNAIFSGVACTAARIRSPSFSRSSSSVTTTISPAAKASIASRTLDWGNGSSPRKPPARQSRWRRENSGSHAQPGNRHPPQNSAGAAYRAFGEFSNAPLRRSQAKRRSISEPPPQCRRRGMRGPPAGTASPARGRYCATPAHRRNGLALGNRHALATSSASSRRSGGNSGSKSFSNTSRASAKSAGPSGKSCIARSSGPSAKQSFACQEGASLARSRGRAASGLQLAFAGAPAGQAPDRGCVRRPACGGRSAARQSPPSARWPAPPRNAPAAGRGGGPRFP